MHIQPNWCLYWSMFLKELFLAQYCTRYTQSTSQSNFYENYQLQGWHNSIESLKSPADIRIRPNQHPDQDMESRGKWILTVSLCKYVLFLSRNDRSFVRSVILPILQWITLEEDFVLLSILRILWIYYSIQYTSWLWGTLNTIEK